MKRFWFFAFLILFLAAETMAQTSSFTYEGRLFSSSGIPLLESVDVKFQILNPAGTCVLYEEVQSGIDLSISKGAFSLGVGSAASDTKRSANFRGAYNPSMISVFRNGATLSGIPAADCAAGTYVAGSSDSRLLRVHVTKGSTTETLSPDLVINTVPSAQVAASLQGFLPSDFLRLDVANGISGNIGLTATGTGAGQTREFRFYELAANGPEYSAFKGPDAMATSLTYVLPSAAPAAGDILKATVPSSGVVTLSWGADAGAGGGISTFNGSNQSSQSFTAVDIAAAVTAPAWSTNAGTGAHTLQIPMAAGAGVTGGLITKTEHTAFSAKVDRTGDTMTGLLNFTGATGVSLAGTSGITFTGTGTIAMGTNKITGVADPSAAQEAATKAYVDSQNSGKIGGTLTATRIPYASGASTLVDSANFTYTTATGAMTIGGTDPSVTSNDAITIAAGGTNKNVVLTPSGTGHTVLNGNVGIGTSAPVANAHIASSTENHNSGTTMLKLESTAGTNPSAKMRFTTPAANWDIYSLGSSLTIGNGDNSGNGVALATSYFSPSNLQVAVNSATGGVANLAVRGHAAIGSTGTYFQATPPAGGLLVEGNVGIGTITPGANLEVVGAVRVRGDATHAADINLVGGNTNDLGIGAHVHSLYGLWIRSSTDGNRIRGMDSSGATAANLGIFANGERITIDQSNGNVGIGATTPASKLHVGSAPTASANYGLVSLGSAPFDGTTAGFFVGHASGTVLAENAASGFAGDLINLQIAGVPKFKVDKDGKIYGDGSTLSNLSGAISGLTAGRVTLSTAATTVGDSANFTFNSTTGAMTVNGSAPSITSGDALTIAAGGTNKNITLTPSGTGVVATAAQVTITNTTANTGTWGDGALVVSGGLGVAGGITANGLISAGNGQIGMSTVGGSYNTSLPGIFAGNGSGSNEFATAGSLVLNAVQSATGTIFFGTGSTLTTRMLISNTGNVGIGTTAPASRFHVALAPTASTNYGLLSLGSGFFDGATAGFFTGHASGTLLAANVAGAYAGDLINLQAAGVQKFKVDKDGKIYGDGSTLSNVSGAISGLTAGQIPFAASATTLANDSNFVWDNTNKRLGIGTAPSYPLHVAGDVRLGSTSNLTFTSTFTNGNILTLTGGNSNSGTGLYIDMNQNTGGATILKGTNTPGTNAGNFYSYSQGANVVFTATAPASAVNGINLSAAVASSAAQITTIGTDTNINLALMPKGTGAVGVGTASPTVKFQVVDSAAGTYSGVASFGNGVYATTISPVAITSLYSNTTTSGTIGGDTTGTALNVQSQSSTDLIEMKSQATSANNNYSGLAFTNRIANGTDTKIAAVRGMITDNTNGAYKGALTFNTSNAAAPAERMRIDSAGNVGIGTSSPGQALTVVGSGVAYDGLASFSQSGDAQLAISSTNANRSLIFLNSLGNQGYAIVNEGTGASRRLGFHTVSGNINTDADVVFTQTGNVGIGLVSPLLPLHVLGAATTTNLGQGRSVLFLDDSTAMAAGTGGGIFFRGLMDGTNYRPWAGIQGVKENATSGNGSGALVFLTRADGSSPAERMRVDSAGNIGMGTAAPSANARLALKDGHLQSQQTTAPTAAVNANAGVGGACTVANATDVAGQITLTGGSSGWAAGAQCTITFNKSYATAPIITMSSGNTAGAVVYTLNALYLTATTTTFTINLTSALTGSGAMIFTYHAIETQ